MFLRHRLNAVLQTAAGADQLLLPIIHFVLIQLQLRLGQFELVVQLILLGSAALGLGGRKLCDARLVRREGILRLLQPRLYLLRLGGQCGRMLRRVEYGQRERQIHLLIAKLQSLAGER